MMGRKGQNRLNSPAAGAVHEGRLDDCASSRFKESLAQGSSIRHADADIFHKPGWARIELAAPRGARKSEIALIETDSSRAGNAQTRGCKAQGFLSWAQKDSYDRPALAGATALAGWGVSR